MQGQKQSSSEQGLLHLEHVQVCLACDYQESILHWGEINKHYLNMKLWNKE